MTTHATLQAAQTLAAQMDRPKSTMPSRAKTKQFVDDLLCLFFPQLCGEASAARDLPATLGAVEEQLSDILAPLAERMASPRSQVIDAFMQRLPALYGKMCADGQAIFEGDPAAESYDEVILTYPGFFATSSQRIAHEFYRLKVPIFPRLITELAHQKTGIDIHPGAEIGSHFCIDHGTGVVVGETAQIGNRVKLYQGVTLGALSVDKSLARKKRHPTLEDGVIVYSNATILGGETVIGHDSVIGGNVWLTSSVPPLSTVYHQSEVKVRNLKPTAGALV